MSVRTGPASDGCAAMHNVEEDSAEVHLHVSLSRHSQGLRRDVTMKNKFRTVLSDGPIPEQ